MKIKNINKLIIKAVERQNDEKAWDMWVTKYPLMITGQIEKEEFKDFKNKIFKSKKKYTEISNEEIEKEFAIFDTKRGENVNGDI